MRWLVHQEYHHVAVQLEWKVGAPQREPREVLPHVATTGVESGAPKGLGFGAHYAQEEPRDSPTLFARSVGRERLAGHYILDRQGIRTALTFQHP